VAHAARQPGTAYGVVGLVLDEVEEPAH
jgi:hypothetical protein